MATRVKAIILFTPSSYTWYNTKPVYVCMILTHLDGNTIKSLLNRIKVVIFKDLPIWFSHVFFTELIYKIMR